MDGRTKGAGIAPDPCAARGGCAGTPPGSVDRAGDEDPIGARAAVLVPGEVGSVRAGIGSGATGADDRSAGLGAAVAGGMGAGATVPTAAGDDNAGVPQAGGVGVIGVASAGVGRAGSAAAIGCAIGGVSRGGVTGVIDGAAAGVARKGPEGTVG